MSGTGSLCSGTDSRRWKESARSHESANGIHRRLGGQPYSDNTRDDASEWAHEDGVSGQWDQRGPDPQDQAMQRQHQLPAPSPRKQRGQQRQQRRKEHRAAAQTSPSPQPATAPEAQQMQRTGEASQTGVHGSGSGGGSGAGDASAAFAGSEFIRNIRSWREAVAALDLLLSREPGGPRAQLAPWAGGPPLPRLLLGLLLQSAAFSRGGRRADRRYRPSRHPQRLPPLSSPPPSAEQLRVGREEDEEDEPDEVVAHGSWAADLDASWEEQVQEHAAWLLTPSTPSGLQDAPRPASQAAVLLPGHAAAAAALSLRSGGGSRSGGPAMPLPSQYIPIPPLRAASDEQWSPAPVQGAEGRRGRQQSAGPGARREVVPPQQGAELRDRDQRRDWRDPVRDAAPQYPHRRWSGAWDSDAAGAPLTAQLSPVARASGRSNTDLGDAADHDVEIDPEEEVRHGEDAALAATVLARVVDHATAGQPEVWTDDTIAQLLRSAAKLSYRYPGLLGGPQHHQRQWNSRAGAVGSGQEHRGAAPLARQRPASSTQAYDVAGRRSEKGSAGAVVVQLRVGLQQLLLRIDGVVPPRRAAAARGSMREGAGGAPGAPAAPGHVSAVYAVWAAAVLQLRLSPDGEVRRRLLQALNPMIERLPRRRARPGALSAAAGAHGSAAREMRMARAEVVRGRLEAGARGYRGGARASALRVADAAALSAGDLAEMMWAVAKLQLQVPMPWLSAAVRLLAGASGGPTPTRRRTAGGAAAVGGRVLPSGASPRGLAALTAVQLTGVAWAVVELRTAAGRDAVTREWARTLYAATEGSLHRLTPSQLVELLWSAARGRRVPNGPWRLTLSGALAAALPSLAAWQLARAAASLAKLRLVLPYQLVVDLLKGLHARLHEAEPADVAALVWSLRWVSQSYTAVLVRTHRRTLLELAAATQPHLLSLPPGQLVQLVDGLANLRLLPGADWMRLHREACLRNKPLFSEANRRKLRQAYATMWTL